LADAELREQLEKLAAADFLFRFYLALDSERRLFAPMRINAPPIPTCEEVFLRRSSPGLNIFATRRRNGMKGKMKIGIIGTGNIGSALTRQFTRLGHDVAVANSRGPESLADLAKETGARPVQVSEVPRGRDLVVVTIPEGKIPQLPRGLFKDAPRNLIVIDTGNYYPRNRDGKIEGIENGLTESRWVEQQLGRPVIKVFNNIYAEHLANWGKPAGTPGRIALPVSGDDDKAKQVVMDLVNDMGFDPVDAGGLDESWRQQPGTPVYAADFDTAGVRRALAQASPERKPEWRATPNSPGTYS
jgi:predicted dinucleotide-binding enzyme